MSPEGLRLDLGTFPSLRGRADLCDQLPDHTAAEIAEMLKSNLNENVLGCGAVLLRPGTFSALTTWLVTGS